MVDERTQIALRRWVREYYAQFIVLDFDLGLRQVSYVLPVRAGEFLDAN